MGRERQHGERAGGSPPQAYSWKRNTESSKQYCVHCKQWGLWFWVSTGASDFWSAELISVRSVRVSGVSPLSPGVLYSSGPSSPAECFWQISTDKLSNTQGAFSTREGTQSLFAMQHDTLCRSCLKCGVRGREGRQVFEDERSFGGGQEFTPRRLKLCRAGCRVSVIFPSPLWSEKLQNAVAVLSVRRPLSVRREGRFKGCTMELCF